jgi:hypothetical protein
MQDIKVYKTCKYEVLKKLGLMPFNNTFYKRLHPFILITYVKFSES